LKNNGHPKYIGITTTVPIEILLSAGYSPLDLNNIFVSDTNPDRLIRLAEKDGFPLNCCAWIKGIYGVCLDKGISEVICVTSGDCSNTQMLREVLNLKGIRTIPFDFPTEPNPAEVKASLSKLALRLGTTLEAAEEWRETLSPARELAHKLDYLCHAGNKISGFEDHYWLVSSSDFNSDYVKYQADLQKLLNTAENRTPYPPTELRLAYLGVPSVFGQELYPYLEQNGARVVFNEIQRQFSLPEGGADISRSYTAYTYPYPMEYRLRDIQTQLTERRIDGIIHYVQAFCHRAIGDIILRQKLPLPMLTLEGNADFHLNQHQKTRLEAFLDMLKAKKQINL